MRQRHEEKSSTHASNSDRKGNRLRARRFKALRPLRRAKVEALQFRNLSVCGEETVNWNLLTIPKDDASAYRDAVRLNSLGSLFFFTHFVLKKHRLAKLHWHMCATLETEDLHLVFEIPMSHFKTSIGVEALSMWWALAFTERDEALMRGLGYDDEWIRWMRAAHDQNARTLVTHETAMRVVSMSKAIDDHYLHNDLFRFAFSDVIPTSDTQWNNHSKMHQRDRAKPSDRTTATYEFRSVGQALQGVHVSGIINDDSVGKAAQDNMLNGDGSIMEDVYRWWKQTTTRFDPEAFTKSGIGRQLVIGNRWGHADLNSKIRANHPEFKFETHDAEGGCCELHPEHGVPIFPEEWTMERLHKQRETLAIEGKGYDYVHFYRNKTVLPEDCLFKPSWLRKFNFKESRPDLDQADPRNFLMIEHYAYDGDAIGDLNVGVLHKRLIVSMASTKKRRRRAHVIAVIGYDSEKDRIYLLYLWAEKVSYGDLIDKIYSVAGRYRRHDSLGGLREFYLGRDEAQAMKFYLDERNRRDKTQALDVNEIDSDDSDSAMNLRIEGMQTLFKNHQFWTHPSWKAFLAEYEAYPAGAIDVLDTLGLAPKTLEDVRRRETLEWVLAQNAAFANRKVGAGGY